MVSELWTANPSRSKEKQMNNKGEFMVKWKKVQDRLMNKAIDITFDELSTLLIHYGYQMKNKGKTSGSRVLFTNKNLQPILVHKPRPAKEMNETSLKGVRELIERLMDEKEEEYE